MTTTRDGRPALSALTAELARPAPEPRTRRRSSLHIAPGGTTPTTPRPRVLRSVPRGRWLMVVTPSCQAGDDLRVPDDTVGAVMIVLPAALAVPILIGVLAALVLVAVHPVEPHPARPHHRTGAR